MPVAVSAETRRQIAGVTEDHDANLKEFEDAYARFLSCLRDTSLDVLRRRTAQAYEPTGRPIPERYLGFHQALHLGQIRTLRNLCRTTRGEPARFHAENPCSPT